MAKSKKSESPASEAASEKPAAKKAPAKKAAPAAAAASPAAKKPAKSAKLATGQSQAPLIDTGLAAQTAAAMVANLGAGQKSPAAGAESKPESSTFKSLKESINKPSAGGLGGILGTGGGSKKFLPNFGGSAKPGGPSSGRNQTFGADVNRANVPRRTGGG